MAQKERPFLNLLINIVIPVFILLKLSKEQYLGPFYGLIVALAFPILYGLYEVVKEKKYNFLSILGVVSILLTGGIGLLQLNNNWLAAKEAGVPLLIAIAILVSLKTNYPLVKKLIYNDSIMNIAKIEEALEEKKSKEQLEKQLKKASYYVAGTFVFSAFLNYILAKIIVVSEPGSVAYNTELGRMTALSFPVIALPSTILLVIVIFSLVKKIKQLTGLEMEEVFKAK
tara:strand:- start:36219 stop:36902 length:684 start_codon:yes stop_codon:yes gene_type:complete